MSLIIFRVNKMASVGAAIWLPDTETFFVELGTIISRAQQQRNATATQFDSSEFFVRRLEEYERTLSVLTTRIEESYAQEITLIGYLNHLLGILNELRFHFEGIAEESERVTDSFEESTTQPIVTITRNGEVGRPRLALAREQLETLHGEAGFRWAAGASPTVVVSHPSQASHLPSNWRSAVILTGIKVH